MYSRNPLSNDLKLLSLVFAVVYIWFMFKPLYVVVYMSCIYTFIPPSSMQQNRLFQTHSQPGMGTAERKVLLVFIYYIFVSVFVLTTSALLEKTADTKHTAIAEYLQCEANGRNNTCVYDTPHYDSAIVLIINALLGLFPAIILVFAINVSEVRAVSKKAIKKLLKTTTFSTTVEADV